VIFQAVKAAVVNSAQMCVWWKASEWWLYCL